MLLPTLQQPNLVRTLTACTTRRKAARFVPSTSTSTFVRIFSFYSGPGDSRFHGSTSFRSLTPRPIFSSPTTSTRNLHSNISGPSKILLGPDKTGDSLQALPSSPFASTPNKTKSSDTAQKPKKRPRPTFIPRKAAVTLTERSRTFFKALIERKQKQRPDVIGIMLHYEQNPTSLRMIFRFDFCTQVSEQDEGVSLEIGEGGAPKSPRESYQDGLPKLYIHHNAFLKVLGATLDVDPQSMTPILYDKEGNQLDPNA